MRRYVAGFLIWQDYEQKRDGLLLVKKNRPEWQADLLNAIGGTVEEGETLEEAMRREFVEETRIDVADWHLFCVERGSDYDVSFFRARMRALSIGGGPPSVPLQNDVGERLRWYTTDLMMQPGDTPPPMVGNLRWLIPMALDWRQLFAAVEAVDDISTRPSW